MTDDLDAVLGEAVAGFPSDEPGLPADDIEDAPPIYMTPGQEGQGNVNARRLVVFVVMPDRRELEWQARNMLLDSDIREAMAEGARRLWAYAQRYNVTGYTMNPEDIEYDIARLDIGKDNTENAVAHTQGLARTLVATVVISR